MTDIDDLKFIGCESTEETIWCKDCNKSNNYENCERHRWKQCYVALYEEPESLDDWLVGLPLKVKKDVFQLVIRNDWCDEADE